MVRTTKNKKSIFEMFEPIDAIGMEEVEVKSEGSLETPDFSKECSFLKFSFEFILIQVCIPLKYHSYVIDEL